MIKAMINKTHNMMTWSENIVQARLKINESIYFFISSYLQREMNKLNILEVRLNTCKVKNLFNQVFANVYNEFNDIFDNILKSQK
jgi:hypothetical protein